MTVDDVDAAIDESVREADMLVGYLVSPVRPPVNRHDDDISRAPCSASAFEDRFGLVQLEITNASGRTRPSSVSASPRRTQSRPDARWDRLHAR